MSDGMEEKMSKVGTPQAKAEMEARRQMAKEDEAVILKGRIADQEAISSEEPDFALYNYIMSVTSFKGINTQRDALHHLYRNLWPHIRRYHNECVESRKTMGEGAKHKPILPHDMAVDTLKKIQASARERAKAKTYGIEVEKRGLLKGNGEL